MATRFLRSSSSSKALCVAASATVIVGSRTLYDKTRCQKAKNGDDDSFRVEVHLMDKIQQKTYLQSAKDGIPSTLRILAIDLPEMRKSAFSGECFLSHDKVFVDDIAPPKIIQVEGKETSKKGEKQPKLQIAQKSLVKRVGVEMLEASVADLNPFKLRKTHQFGKYKYDPGKYYGSEKNKVKNQDERENDDDEIDEVDQAEVSLDKASYDDEIEAPWNQYAWAEELRLRINGQVSFGAPMGKSSSLQRYIFGNVFKVTVPAVSRFWEWPLPSFARSDPNGLDGRIKTNCRACNKPHAVIANGAALQRAPSALRLLQKTCNNADVPLFVLHDPRVWGGNTHQTLPEALREMRATIKHRAITGALKQQGSSAFTKGRMMGRVEMEAKWQLKEKSRKAKEMFTGKEWRRRKSEEPKDWSQLDLNLLEKKLVERGVIQKKKEGEGGDKRVYTGAMVAVARQCVKDEDEHHKNLEDAETKIEVQATGDSTNTTST